MPTEPDPRGPPQAGLRGLPAETLAEILDAAPAAVHVKDLAGRYIFVNRQAASMIGIDPLTAIGQTPSDLLGPDAARVTTANDRAVLESGEALEREEVVPFPDGTTRTFVSLKFPIHDETGAISGVAGISTDITDRARIADELRVTAERLEHVLAEAPIALSAADAQGILTFLGGKLVSDAGIDAAGMVGRPFTDLLQDSPERLAAVQRVLSGEPVTSEVEQSGRIAERRLVPLFDDTGRPAGMIGVHFDITERRRAEDEVRASRDQLAYLLAESPVLIGESDLSDRTARFVSPNIERLFGYRPEDVVGVPDWLMAHVHPDDRGVALKMREEAAGAGSGVAEAQFRFRRCGGDYRWVTVRIRLVPEADGNPGRILWHATDVTDRVEAEAQRRALEERLRQSERLESLGGLAGGIAHDFNNLLTVVLINAGFVRDGLADLPAETSEELRAARAALLEYVAEIELVARRGAELTRGLLAFGRVEPDQDGVAGPAEVLAGLDSLLRHTIGEHIDLAVRVPAGVWDVPIAPGALERVVVNLAANAVGAMAGGGTLAISVENLEPDGAWTERHPGIGAGRHVCLSVADTGRGMTPEVAKRAFEPFFTTKERGSGTGLGLATVYGLVRHAGGTVEISSEPGLGTTVKVFLPAHGRAGVAPEAAPAPVRAARGETILVVDDAEGVRRAARGILEQHGYSVIEAAGPADALAVCAGEGPPLDLLLTDVVMPGMSGVLLASRVRHRHPHLRVVFMSGYPGETLPGYDHLERTGRFVPKPFGSEQLLRAVGEALAVARPPTAT